MRWACEVGSNFSGFHVVVENIERSRSTIGLAQLISHGLPSESGGSQVVTLDLSAGRPADPEEYLRAFGFGPSTRASQHLVFEFKTAQTRFLVPALALMRALFRPARYLLPEMFAPQALDHVRFVQVRVGTPHITVHASWKNVRLRNYGDILGPLGWMTFFPTAATMASSVHGFASRGVLGLTLPRATAKLSASGVKVGETLFATRIAMVEVCAEEPPVQFATEYSPRVAYRTVTRGGRFPPKRDDSLPLRPDGEVDVTDYEWEVIKPILMGRTPARRFKLDQRRIFDGVLRKLSLGTSWNETDYPEGGRENALHAWRSWSANGRWGDAIARLDELRHVAPATRE
jgi:hypothetical protein